MSTRAFAYLSCAHCKDVVLHRGNVCVRCATSNHSSGNAPVPRAREYGYASMPRKQYAAAQASLARKRARAARHQLGARK